MQARLAKFSDESLINLARRMIEACDKTMRLNAEGGLSFGWDWPTFSVLFPRKYRAMLKIKAEGRRRGLDKKRAA
jgi:hypothetical protein